MTFKYIKEENIKEIIKESWQNEILLEIANQLKEIKRILTKIERR